MNMHFNKALYFLGRGDFEKGEKLIGQALNECTNKLEMIQIKSCYMEVLYEQKKYDEANACAEYILSNTSDNEMIRERKIAIMIHNKIQGGLL